LASAELINETTPQVIGTARKIVFNQAFENNGRIRKRDIRRAIRRSTGEVGTKPWPGHAVDAGAEALSNDLGAVEENGNLTVPYLATFTRYQPQLVRLVMELAQEWWGFIPEEEIWRVAPAFEFDGENWAEHHLAQEAIDQLVYLAGGIRLTSSSRMANGYQFPSIMRGYSKVHDVE
jgi:hypothetical protein